MMKSPYIYTAGVAVLLVAGLLYWQATTTGPVERLAPPEQQVVEQPIVPEPSPVDAYVVPKAIAPDKYVGFQKQPIVPEPSPVDVYVVPKADKYLGFQDWNNAQPAGPP